MSDQVDFLHLEKHESLKCIVWRWSRTPKVHKIGNLQCLSNIWKKIKAEVDFFFACRVSYKFISTLWVSNFPTRLILSLLMGMIKCSQITQSNKCSISLQYLQKEVRNGDPFWHADKRPVWLNGRVFVYELSTVH